MSFGRRPILFFLLIVVLPMLAVAGLLLAVTAESRTGKADARLAAGLETALALDREQIAEARRIGSQLAKDPGLSASLRSGDGAEAEAAAARLAREPGVTGVRIVAPGAAQLAAAGAPNAIGFADVDLQAPSGPLGTLRVARGTAPAFVNRVAALTGRDAVVIAPSGELGGTRQLGPDDAPGAGDTKQITLRQRRRRRRTDG